MVFLGYASNIFQFPLCAKNLKTNYISALQKSFLNSFIQALLSFSSNELRIISSLTETVVPILSQQLTFSANINPFLPNGFLYLNNSLDQFSSNSKDVRLIFIIATEIPVLKANSEDPDLMLHSRTSDQSLHILPMSLIWTLGINGLKTQIGIKHDHNPLIIEPSPGPQVIKLLSCSAQLSMKCSVLINVKIPTLYSCHVHINWRRSFHAQLCLARKNLQL